MVSLKTACILILLFLLLEVGACFGCSGPATDGVVCSLASSLLMRINCWLFLGGLDIVGIIIGVSFKMWWQRTRGQPSLQELLINERPTTPASEESARALDEGSSSSEERVGTSAGENTKTLEEALPQFTWIHRMGIASSIAQSLVSLHKESSHGNIKAANVLLDDNSVARLSDTSLAVPNPQSSNKIKSDASQDELKKDDVYAFGVLLLELLAGKIPFDRSKPVPENFLAIWASSVEPDSRFLAEFVDPTMAMSKEVLQRFSSLIASCLQTDPTLRPQMEEVSLELENLNDELLWRSRM